MSELVRENSKELCLTTKFIDIDVFIGAISSIFSFAEFFTSSTTSRVVFLDIEMELIDECICFCGNGVDGFYGCVEFCEFFLGSSDSDIECRLFSL